MEALLMVSFKGLIAAGMFLFALFQISALEKAKDEIYSLIFSLESDIDRLEDKIKDLERKLDF